MKFAARLGSVSTGSGSSSPTSDHVPDEMYAAAAPSGAAATADAVSCEATASTGTSPSPVTSRTSGTRCPTTVPGSTSSGSLSRSPASGGYSAASRSRSSADQVREVASSRPVVDALVTSATRRPVSQ